MRFENRQTLSNAYRMIPFTMLTLGLFSLLASAFANAYVLAFIGLGLAFWGGLLIYLKPSKHVRLELLTATASSALFNIERILADAEPNMKGVYLPPKRLKAYESSLIFVPSKPSEILPEQDETDNLNLYSRGRKGLFITPPGLALSKLLERELGKSFTRTDLSEIRSALPRVFEELELARDTNVQVEGNFVSIETRDHIFKDLFEETSRLQKTQEVVGCPFSSAIACALAKAAGKPVVIEREQENVDGTTQITYRFLEE